MYEVEMRPLSGRQICALQALRSSRDSQSNYFALIAMLLAGCTGLSGCGGVVFNAGGSSGTTTANTIQLVASPATVDFGTVSVGNSANQKVAIANTGSDAVQISQLSLSNPAFRLDGQGKLPVSLAAGASLSLNLHFAPSQSADVTGQLSVMVENASTAAATVYLHGKGSASAQAAAEIIGLSCDNLKMTGSGTDNCTVDTSAAVPSGGLSVDLKSSTPEVKVPASVTVPVGAASVKFYATVSAVTTNQTAIITATQGSVAKSVSISLSPVQTAPASAPVLSALSCASTSFAGAGKTACTVSLNAAASKALTVALASNSSAVSIPASLTVNAGSTTASFTATVNAVSKAQTVTVSATADGSSKSVAFQLNPSSGSVPTLSLSSSTLTFGDVSVGASLSKSLTLTSTGTTPLTIKSDSITGTGFSLAGDPFPATLNPGQKIVLSVQFKPAAADSVTGQLSISSNAGTASVGLSGTGTAVASALSGISCKSTSIAGSLADACAVSLSGPAPKNGAIIAVTSNSKNVTVPSSVTVPANATSVTFTADAAAVSNAQSVTLTATLGSTSKSVSLQLNPAVAQLTANATSISFGGIVINVPTAQVVTLTSVGKAAVTVKSASVTGAAFSLSPVSLPATLSPGQTLLLTLTFQPTTTGSQSGQLTVVSNSSTNPTIAIPLSGTGDAHQVQLNWNPPLNSPEPITRYKVYRASGGSGAFHNVASTGQTDYADMNVQSGQRYEYYVTSVDSAGVESAPSNTTTVIVP